MEKQFEKPAGALKSNPNTKAKDAAKAEQETEVKTESDGQVATTQQEQETPAQSAGGAYESPLIRGI